MGGAPDSRSPPATASPAVAIGVPSAPQALTFASPTGAYPLRRDEREAAMRMLLVEDDRMIGDSLRHALKFEGHAVDWVYGAAAAQSVGLGVLRALRTRGDATAVIVLTARDALADRVAGLDAGADDYLVKPFELDELLARIRAVARRHAGRADTALEHNGVRLDPATREVTRDGEPVLLSAREVAVLEALMQRPGAVLSRVQLEDRLYGWGDAVESNAVTVYVHQLRRKLGSDFIASMRGVGYFLPKAAPRR